MTNRKRQLTFILVVVVAFCSAVSHLAIYWLKIRALPVGYHHYGLKGERADTVLFGSSLAYDGLDWVSRFLKRKESPSRLGPRLALLPQSGRWSTTGRPTSLAFSLFVLQPMISTNTGFAIFVLTSCP